jgi:hypothetical protein
MHCPASDTDIRFHASVSDTGCAHSPSPLQTNFEQSDVYRFRRPSGTGTGTGIDDGAVRSFSFFFPPPARVVLGVGLRSVCEYSISDLSDSERMVTTETESMTVTILVTQVGWVDSSKGKEKQQGRVEQIDDGGGESETHMTTRVGWLYDGEVTRERKKYTTKHFSTLGTTHRVVQRVLRRFVCRTTNIAHVADTARQCSWWWRHTSLWRRARAAGTAAAERRQLQDRTRLHQWETRVGHRATTVNAQGERGIPRE